MKHNLTSYPSEINYKILILGQAPSEITAEQPGKFEKFNLKENPFPSEPTVNKDSEDKRINGDIYEAEIRRIELDLVKANFLQQSQSTPNHLRLGYIIDRSYIGRGNGKSAFLVNLQNMINDDYADEVSSGINKCFALYTDPEPGGRTKSFSSFIDLLVSFMIRSGIIRACIATLRLEIIRQLYPSLKLESQSDSALIKNLNDLEWFKANKVNLSSVSENIRKNKHLQELPSEFPLFGGRTLFQNQLISETEFEDYYFKILKKGKPRLEFFFSHLVKYFMAAGFNGAYILVDDFERIPDFQSARQKKDFALELRSCLFDGMYLNARVGFYTYLLVLHAGVPRVIKDSWAESGMENRAPISPLTASRHIIPFEKISKEHVTLLLKKYLSEYRIKASSKGSKELLPFTESAVIKIGELSEYNAAKILKMSYDLLDKAAELDGQVIIDEKFVTDNRPAEDHSDGGKIAIEDAESIDLLKKAKDQD
jgi:hypothetical protein